MRFLNRKHGLLAGASAHRLRHRGRFFQRANPYRSTRRGDAGWIAFRGAVETAGLQTRNVNWKH
jgi:hypothetical protein